MAEESISSVPGVNGEELILFFLINSLSLVKDSVGSLTFG